MKKPFDNESSLKKTRNLDTVNKTDNTLDKKSKDSKNLTQKYLKNEHSDTSTISTSTRIRTIREKLKHPNTTALSKITKSINSYQITGGRIIYQMAKQQIIFWCPPQSAWKCLHGMPFGYEIGLTPHGSIYFINHVKMTTTTVLPIEEKSLEEPPIISSTSKTIEVKLKVKISDPGIEFISENYLKISKISKNSPLESYLKIGDFISSVNSSKIESKNAFCKLIKNLSYFKITIGKAENNESVVGNKMVIKSSIKSEERKEYLKKFPARVHFTEELKIFEYTKTQIANIWEKKDTKQFSLNILKIYFMNGMSKSVQVGPNQTISNLVSLFLKKIDIKYEQCFTLALMSTNNYEVEYYGSDQLVINLMKQKEKSKQDCYLLIFTYPPVIKNWESKTYRNIVKYLFEQFKFFLLTVKSPIILGVPLSELHQLIAFLAAIDFMINNQNLKRKSSQEQVDKDMASILNTRKKNLSPANNVILPTIRLSTFNLEQHNLFPSYCTLCNKRDDIDLYQITSLMINCFDVLTTNEMKLFFLNPNYSSSIQNILLETLQKNIYHTIHKAQMSFIEICNMMKMYPYAKYRVHVLPSSLNKKNNSTTAGEPITIGITPLTLFHIDNNNKTQVIIKISDITTLLACYGNLNKFMINIFCLENKHTSITSSSNNFRAIIWLLASYCNELWKEVPTINVPVIDITNISYRCEEHQLPSYNDAHLVISSTWNYTKNTTEFFKDYCYITKNRSLDYFKILSPYFMIYNSSRETKLSFVNDPIIPCFHLQFAHFDIKDLYKNKEDTNIINELQSGKKDKNEESSFSVALLPDEIELMRSRASKKIKINDV